MGRARAAALARGLNWVVLGDFNRDPARITLPRGGFLYNPRQPTQRSGGELDYMASNVHNFDWEATVAVNRGSDHWPVIFDAWHAAGGFVHLSSDSNGGLMEAERSYALVTGSLSVAQSAF